MYITFASAKANKAEPTRSMALKPREYITREDFIKRIQYKY